jgi:hypothetical protein
MQVGQILQSLALLPYEDPPASYMDEILSKINQNMMPQILRTVLGSDVLRYIRHYFFRVAVENCVI